MDSFETYIETYLKRDASVYNSYQAWLSDSPAQIRLEEYGNCYSNKTWQLTIGEMTNKIQKWM